MPLWISSKIIPFILRYCIIVVCKHIFSQLSIFFSACDHGYDYDWLVPAIVTRLQIVWVRLSSGL